MGKEVVKSIIRGGVIGTTIIKLSPIVDTFIFTTCKNAVLYKGLMISELLVPNWFLAIVVLGAYAKIKYPYVKKEVKKQ